MRDRSYLAIALFGVVAVLTLGITPPYASAALAAPTGLDPDGTSASTNPVLSWTGVQSATSYRVELSRSSTFDSLAVPAITTVNRQVTPTATLPSGEIFWRVRAGNSVGSVSAWSTASFILDPMAAPAQLSPADGEALDQPNEPSQLVWAPVSGATSYEVAVGTDPNLSSSTSYTTKTTSYAFGTPQSQATYYWRVRALLGSGQATEWSGTRSYDVLPLDQPALVSPANSPDTVVTDVVLAWSPIPGASKYEVRVSNDSSFGAGNVVAQATTFATRWSPAVTLDNDQYWWQVRAYDSQGQTKDWAELGQTWQFERRWQFGDTTLLDPERPVLLHPANGVAPATTEPFFYDWEPVRLGSEYELQVGWDPNFSAETFDVCTTKQTTFTPVERFVPTGGLIRPLRRSCMPASGGTYYWRVRALDRPKPVMSQWSDIRSFTYRPGGVGLDAPAHGASVAVPTMSWRHDLGAERYKLTYSYGSTTKTVTTYSTSYTPPAKLPDGASVTWFVQAIYANDDISALPLNGSRSFAVSGTPQTGSAPDPVATDPAGDRFPSLSWTPVAGAANYRVWVGTAGTGVFRQLPDTYQYPAGTDATDDHLAAKAYDWFVRAYDGSGAVLATGSVGTFAIQDLGSVAGEGVAHTGTELDSALRCGLLLTDGTAADVCPARQTPVLDWDPVVGAAYYEVTVARDESLTNRVYDGFVTHNTRWTPTELLPDSQAGQAYYWVVRPCKAPGVCAPDPTVATNAFDKTSHRVEITSPLDSATVADAVTFSWRGYLLTNAAQAAAARSRVEAKQYKIDISTSPTFQTILDTATVDQTTYTAPSKIYPEGPLYWRVSVLDGSANTVGTSATQSATKQSAVVLLQAPGDGSTSPRTPALRWRPRAFTSSYDIEVYKDGDINFSPVNRVLGVNSRLSAYSLTTPLPAAPLPYVWRVRSRDVSGNPGPWSAPRTFIVRGTAPALVAPAAGVRVSATAGLFTWAAEPEATSYRFERRPGGGTSASETVNTVALAWAPTSKLSDGTWEWRVSTVDAAGRVVATSAWRSFWVDGTAPTVATVSPSSAGRPRTNVTATFSERVRGVSTGTMKLFQQGRQHPVTAAVTLSGDKQKATLNPARNLLVGRTYRAVLTSGITDRARNPLVKKEWTFTVSQ